MTKESVDVVSNALKLLQTNFDKPVDKHTARKIADMFCIYSYSTGIQTKFDVGSPVTGKELANDLCQQSPHRKYLKLAIQLLVLGEEVRDIRKTLSNNL